MLPMSMRDNLTLPILRRVSHCGVLDAPRERRLARRIIERLAIRTSRPALQAVGTLSGGNQQKVLIGRWLLADCECCCSTTSPAASTWHQARPLRADDRAHRRGQVDPVLLQRDRGDGASLPPRAGDARGPRSPPSSRRRTSTRRRSWRRGARRMNAVAPAPPALPTPHRWQHLASQSAPLLLALTSCSHGAVYSALFYQQLHRLPGDFEWTTSVTTRCRWCSPPWGRRIVVITRGLDLSVGGMMDLTNSLAATHMHEGVGSMLGWSLVSLLIGAAGGLLNGVLVAYGRLQPILVTLATLSIFQGLAIRRAAAARRAVPLDYTKPWPTRRPVGAALWSCWSALWLVFRRTSFGVGVYAIGNDEGAARAHRRRRCGAIKVCAYVLAACWPRPAGCSSPPRHRRRRRPRGDAFMLTSIAAVVLGGISFFGGRGTPSAHLRRVRADAADQRPLLRPHRPALPVLLPGPVPGRACCSARGRPLLRTRG